MGSIKKSNRRPLLNQAHKEKRKVWARDNMKTDFSNVVFTDESWVTLDGPDGWSKPVGSTRQRSANHQETTARWGHDVGWNLW